MGIYTDFALRLSQHILKSALKGKASSSFSANNLRRFKKIRGMCEREQRRFMTHSAIDELGPKVQMGPFKGMLLQEKESWGEGDTLPKILGTYEAELAPIFIALKDIPFQRLINIGCAEGYFTVGCALALNIDEVIAVDLDSKALQLCEENKKNNEVDTTFHFQSSISSEHLQSILSDYPKSLVLCDCEGYEKTLLGSLDTSAAKESHFIVECHDFVDPEITPLLKSKFQTSHNVQIIQESERDPNQIEFLRNYDSGDRWLAISENRPETMHWLIATPR